MDSRTMDDALYRIVEEETHREVVAGIDLVGFFQAESDEPLPNARLIATSWPQDAVPVAVSEAEIQVIDQRKEIIGSYYVNEVRMIDVRPGAQPGRTDVELRLGYCLPFSYAGPFWRRRARGAPETLGQWAHLPPEQRESWLHVVQCAWFSGGKMATRYGRGVSYTLDGRDILNEASFYCAIGEAVNGPGGYFGSTPAGLIDCLRSSCISHEPFRLRWEHFDESVEGLGRSEADLIAGVLRDQGVDLQLE